MLTTKEQRQLDRLLKKQSAPPRPVTEDTLEQMEKSIDDVYDRAPALMGDGLTANRNFCKALEVLAEHNNTLVREVRRLNRDIGLLKNPTTEKKDA